MKSGLIVFLALLAAGSLHAQHYVAGFEVAKEEVLRSIPEEYINKARTELHVAYQHSSHGTHVAYGLYGLPDYKAGDSQRFAISNNRVEGKLEFQDYAMQDYAAAGESAVDLSEADETTFIRATRNFLDDSKNAHINVIMWSWCSISWRQVAANYFPGMDSLISEYGPGGSKIESGDGRGEVPVTFIFMTGHAEKDENAGYERPAPQAKLITDYCVKNGHFCLDYYSIDSHDMNDNYWEDVSDDGDSDSYGGNFYKDWQNSHALGTDWFENKNGPDGGVEWGNHNTQHITANRKGYAMWWILARIAGWDGNTVTSNELRFSDPVSVYPNPAKGVICIDLPEESGINSIRVFNMNGAEVMAPCSKPAHSHALVDLSGYPAGLYGIQVESENEEVRMASVILSK